MASMAKAEEEADVEEGSATQKSTTTAKTPKKMTVGIQLDDAEGGSDEDSFSAAVAEGGVAEDRGASESASSATMIKKKKPSPPIHLPSSSSAASESASESATTLNGFRRPPPRHRGAGSGQLLPQSSGSATAFAAESIARALHPHRRSRPPSPIPVAASSSSFDVAGVRGNAAGASTAVIDEETHASPFDDGGKHGNSDRGNGNGNDASDDDSDAKKKAKKLLQQKRLKPGDHDDGNDSEAAHDQEPQQHQRSNSSPFGGKKLTLQKIFCIPKKINFRISKDRKQILHF